MMHRTRYSLIGGFGCLLFFAGCGLPNGMCIYGILLMLIGVLVVLIAVLADRADFAAKTVADFLDKPSLSATDCLTVIPGVFRYMQKNNDAKTKRRKQYESLRFEFPNG